MTIEEKALALWGPTDDPSVGLYILKDGTMLNGGGHGYGNRVVDHVEINQFFKPSKFQEPGSSYVYIKKFVRRGNIRMSGCGCTVTFELYAPPTPAQWRTMGRCFAYARREDKPVEIERLPRLLSARGNRLYSRESYIEYLKRYVPGLIAA